MLSSSRGQGNFRGLEASRPRTRPLRPRPRTSKCVLEAKDVLKDSTSDNDTKRICEVATRFVLAQGTHPATRAIFVLFAKENCNWNIGCLLTFLLYMSFSATLLLHTFCLQLPTTVTQYSQLNAFKFNHCYTAIFEMYYPLPKSTG